MPAPPGVAVGRCWGRQVLEEDADVSGLGVLDLPRGGASGGAALMPASPGVAVGVGGTVAGAGGAA